MKIIQHTTFCPPYLYYGRANLYACAPSKVSFCGCILFSCRFCTVLLLMFFVVSSKMQVRKHESA